MLPASSPPKKNLRTRRARMAPSSGIPAPIGKMTTVAENLQVAEAVYAPKSTKTAAAKKPATKKVTTKKAAAKAAGGDNIPELPIVISRTPRKARPAPPTVEELIASGLPIEDMENVDHLTPEDFTQLFDHVVSQEMNRLNAQMDALDKLETEKVEKESNALVSSESVALMSEGSGGATTRTPVSKALSSKTPARKMRVFKTLATKSKRTSATTTEVLASTEKGKQMSAAASPMTAPEKSASDKPTSEVVKPNSQDLENNENEVSQPATAPPSAVETLSSAPITKEAAKPKRSVGRPAKSIANKKVFNTPVSVKVSMPTKSVGQPQKSPGLVPVLTAPEAISKPRESVGRPKKSVKNENVDSTQIKETMQAKRSVGRPRKSAARDINSSPASEKKSQAKRLVGQPHKLAINENINSTPLSEDKPLAKLSIGRQKLNTPKHVLQTPNTSGSGVAVEVYSTPTCSPEYRTPQRTSKRKGTPTTGIKTRTPARKMRRGTPMGKCCKLSQFRILSDSYQKNFGQVEYKTVNESFPQEYETLDGMNVAML